MDPCKRCRKFGAKLFLKGERCLSPKCSFTRRNYQPGARGGKKGIARKSEYGTQLFEKQKAKAEYGLRERAFAKIFHEASRSRENTGEELLRSLELRLDNLIYRLGWAPSRAAARQLVTHRKIKLNNQIVNIPSIKLRAKDKILPVKKEIIKADKVTPPKWLKLDAKNITAEVVRIPIREEIESDLDEQLIIEFYSR